MSFIAIRVVPFAWVLLEEIAPRKHGLELRQIMNGQQYPDSITAEMDRRNGMIYFLSNAFYYFASPVLYVGVVQAALCDRLGANAFVANMPTAAYGVGNILPVVLFPIIPYRLERAAVVISNWALAAGLLGVSLTLFLPCSNSVRIAAVVGQGMITGLALSVSSVYMYQCLGRGTTVEGRARTFKLTYSVGPICAVLAALGTQFLLTRGIKAQEYASSFGILFLVGVPLTAATAILSGRYELVRLNEKHRADFFKFFSGAVKSFGGDSKLIFLWLAYFLWTFSYYTEPTISLHVQQVLGKPPQEFSGILLFLRFGCKAVAGYAIGAIAVKRGIRSPALAAILLTGFAIAWAYWVPGNLYLVAFGFAGAGELADVYLNNYAITISSPEKGAGNLSLLHLAVPMAGIAPLVYGALADSYGFRLSIISGIVPLLISLLLVSRLPLVINSGRVSVDV